MTRRWHQMTREERIEAIRELKPQYSQNEIGRALGTTNSAVAGLIRRAIPELQTGLSPRNAERREPRQRVRLGKIAAAIVQPMPDMARGESTPSAPKKPTQPPRSNGVAPKPLNGTGVSIFDKTRRQCAWPLSGKERIPIEEKRFCGQPVGGEGDAYCRYHDDVSAGRIHPAHDEPERQAA